MGADGEGGKDRREKKKGVRRKRTETTTNGEGVEGCELVFGFHDRKGRKKKKPVSWGGRKNGPGKRGWSGKDAEKARSVIEKVNRV